MKSNKKKTNNGNNKENVNKDMSKTVLTIIPATKAIEVV